MYVATERETSDNTEATRFSQCAHDQRRRLEAEDCNSIRCAQLISGGRRRIRPPCTVPRSRSPTMRCIRLVIYTSCSDEVKYNWRVEKQSGLTQSQVWEIAWNVQKSYKKQSTKVNVRKLNHHQLLKHIIRVFPTCYVEISFSCVRPLCFSGL